MGDAALGVVYISALRPGATVGGEKRERKVADMWVQNSIRPTGQSITGTLFSSRAADKRMEGEKVGALHACIHKCTSSGV